MRRPLNLIVLVVFFTAGVVNVKADCSPAKYRLPAEWEPHKRTLMQWPRSDRVWGFSLIEYVREDIARIANAIVKFEPVVMFVNPGHEAAAKEQLDRNVKVVSMNVDDLWARDTMPVFLSKIQNGKESISGADFNFNGWGNKQVHSNDAQLASKVLKMFGMEKISTHIVGEGGSFQTDGKGTLLVTKSSLVNKNRNTKTLEAIEVELKRVLGIRKVIWFDGVEGEDITDAHVDCLVRFVRPGTVLLNRPFPGEPVDSWSISSDQALRVLKSSTDADGNPFEIIALQEPDGKKILGNKHSSTLVKSYVNFYIGNGFVIFPEFGDFESDQTAERILKEQFPGRTIVPVQIKNIAEGGGGIHCATCEEPAVRP